MKIHPLLEKRWSPVAFSDKPVTEQTLNTLFEAARWAPSSRNVQPWRFIVAFKEDPHYPTLFELLYEGNKVWAHTAPVLALSVAELIPAGRNTENIYAFHDTGMAMGNLLVQATEMDLYVHQMGGYDREKAIKELDIAQRYAPVAMMAVGYKGDPGKLPPEVAEREISSRTRKKTDEFVFRGTFRDF